MTNNQHPNHHQLHRSSLNWEEWWISLSDRPPPRYLISSVQRCVVLILFSDPLLYLPSERWVKEVKTLQCNRPPNVTNCCGSKVEAGCSWKRLGRTSARNKRLWSLNVHCSPPAITHHSLTHTHIQTTCLTPRLTTFQILVDSLPLKGCKP